MSNKTILDRKSFIHDPKNEMTLKAFQNKYFSKMSDAKLMFIIKELGLINRFGRPKKINSEHKIVFLQECNDPILPDSEFLFGTNIVMVGAPEFLKNCIKIYKTVESVEKKRDRRLADQNRQVETF